MAQDTALLRYLLKGARRAPGSGSQRDLAFEFDGTDDYISSNATIGRTGYDMNVSGNVSTGSDGDGSYFGFTLVPQSLLVTTTAIAPMSVASAFSYTIKIKTGSDVTSVQTIANNIISTSNRITICLTTGELRVGIYNGTSYIGKKSFSISTNTTYVIHYTRDGSSVGNLYLAGVDQPTVPAGDPTSSGTIGFSLSRAGSGFLGNIYYFACRNKALSQAEIDADIALGNTTKNDPSIVAYYIPDNLTYNTQYMLNPKELDNASWVKAGATTVTADTTVAPDGTTTADTLAISGTATQGVNYSNTTVTGSSLSSKTFIVKAFVKVTSGTSLFRLEMSHGNVAAYYSSNQTATTTRQEFTFTKTFTSSTSGTGIIGGVSNDTGATNPTLLVRNVRVFLTNETLRDESPNIGGFIGWKTQKVLSCRYKPAADFADSADAGCLISQPRAYLHDRASNHRPQIRYDNRIGARTSIAIPLGSGFRGKVHVLGVVYLEGGLFKTKFYTNGVLVDSDNNSVDAPASSVNTVMRNGRKGSTYFSGNIRDARIYTFTGSFTDADALAIYNGGEPISSGVTKYLQYRPPVGEVGTTTQDQSPNDRDGTLNGGVTRDYI